MIDGYIIFRALKSRILRQIIQEMFISNFIITIIITIILPSHDINPHMSVYTFRCLSQNLRKKINNVHLKARQGKFYKLALIGYYNLALIFSKSISIESLKQENIM